jgi:Na+-driven multidrug efflux pump
VDTAIVGHLGRPQLAALGIAVVILGGVFAVFNFLQYGTTAQVARAGGAGEGETARRLGAQAVWLSLAFGIAVSAPIAIFAEQLVALMGGEGQAAEYAVTYLRIAAIGFPAAFLALVLDSIAIAGQIIVGRELGAGRPERAYAASARMIWLSVAAGGAFTVLMLLLADLVPRIFTGDASVLEQAVLLWPLFALVQPLSGAVFALDGILIGVGDGPFLAYSMVAAFAACASVLGVALASDWGIRGVWGALVVLVVVRLTAMSARFRRGRWLVTGWA